jgi:hypothetical protein
MDSLQGYRPWARWLMMSRMWWILLVMHTVFSPVSLLIFGVADMLRDGWADYVRLFGEVRRDRDSVVRAQKA